MLHALLLGLLALAGLPAAPGTGLLRGAGVAGSGNGTALTVSAAAASSPVPTKASTTYSWTIGADAMHHGERITSVELSGCWQARRVARAAVRLHSHGRTLRARTNSRNGVITVDHLRQADLPLRITVTFRARFGRAAGAAHLVVQARTSKPVRHERAIDGPLCGAAPALTKPRHAASSDFTWSINRVVLEGGRQIATVELAGCWSVAQIRQVTAHAGKGKRAVPVRLDRQARTVKVEHVQARLLPLTITLRFSAVLARARSGTRIALRASGRQDARLSFSVGGPVCRSVPRPTPTPVKAPSPRTSAPPRGGAVPATATAVPTTAPPAATATARPSSGSGTTPPTPPPTATPPRAVTAAPAPTPTEEPEELTSTPVGTATSLPTQTAEPTATQVPTATLTPTPLATATPTASAQQGDGRSSDLQAVAPPLDDSAVTSLISATQFLYSGDNPVQTGVVAGTIELTRTAVLRGRVLTQDGQPLAGVTITIMDHPEFGQTVTRAGGDFDLVVNGGGLLTIGYAKDGFLPAQRQVAAPWQDYAFLPDVALAPLDNQVTSVDLNSSVPIQVAQSSVVSDADGTRQATLLFAQGTTATMIMSGGATQPLSTLHVRATEYTVGADGPQTMPAALPDSSGYTYAADFSADEARAAGAITVTFSQPVPVYVQNFVGFPVGMAVPAGYYDAVQGQWVPSQNGLVIGILSVTSGLADLDLGSGQPATVTALAALGITDAERQQLAALYAPGQSLWRVPITHFTPWDFNWPFGPPLDATSPNQPPPDANTSCDCPSGASGSIIGVENQTLGEQVGLAGTGFALHYQSDRTVGRTDAYTLSIPLSGASVPADLAGIDLEVDVAGRQFTQSFAAAPNQRTSFAWDGKDAYGRVVQGQQAYTVRIGYRYGAVYQTPQQNQQAFAALSGVTIQGLKARQQVALVQEFHGLLGTFDARALGLSGWSLTVQHAYDPGAGVLYLGTGGQRSAQSLNSSISTTAGTGQACDPTTAPCGDGGPATQALLDQASGLAVGADGTLYIADEHNQRVRRVGPDGIISTIAGTGQACADPTAACGDGGPATQAQLNRPFGIAVSPDGSVYVADRGDQRVRRIGPDGVISTVAGTGQTCGSPTAPCGDDGSATQAQFNLPAGLALGADGSLYIADEGDARVRRVGPDGLISSVVGTGQTCFNAAFTCGDGGPASAAALADPLGVAVSPDGSLYVADDVQDRVRRVGPDGIIKTVIGDGTACVPTTASCGDGGPATAAQLNAFGVAVGADGGLYVTDFTGERVRAVSPDGTISTVAGNGLQCAPTTAPCGDGGSAAAAQFVTPMYVAVGPDGSLYITDHSTSRVRVVGRTLPQATSAAQLIPSPDGREIYAFDSAGRHLQTLDARTGATLFSFSYDAAGRLATITDADGNVTTVERDAGGNPTAIVGPFGRRTTLALDANGYLSTITDPLSHTVALTSTATGLLTDLADQRGNLHHFSYDDQGRLLTDADPAGGLTTLVRGGDETDSTVAKGVALDATTTYTSIFRLQNLPDGTINRVTTSPDGLQGQAQTGTNGVSMLAAADGTSQSIVYGPDPRFGMQASLPISQTLTTPDGLAQTILTTRTVALADPNDLLSLQALTDTTSLNGRTYASRYDAASRTLTTTSPLGRQRTVIVDARGHIVSDAVAGLTPLQVGYDAQGRPITVVQGTRTYTMTYDDHGDMISIGDPLSRTIAMAYDAAGRLITQTLPDGRQVGYGYDASGNVTTVTPPGRSAHTFSYTPLDQTQSYTPPTGGPITPTLYTYTRDRRLATITRPDGSTVVRGFDAAGRLSTITTPGGVTRFSFDAAGRPNAVSAPDGGSIGYSYDGALITGLTYSGAVGGAVTRAYDSNFRPISETVAGVTGAANTVTYSYDDDSLLIAAGALTIDYDPLNGLLSGTSLGIITDTLGYNSFAEPVTYVAAAAVAPLFSGQYTRDALGRLSAKTETIAGQTHTYAYTYDLDGRLSAVTQDGATVAQYSYDDNGNRLSVTTPASGTVSGSYDGQDRLIQYGSLAYAYTVNGEVQSVTDAATHATTSYGYDALGNLTHVTLPDGTALDYVIDGWNRRIGKRVDGALTQGFLYDGRQTGPVAELDGTGAVRSVFVYATAATVPDYMIQGGTTYRLICDERGSVRLVVDAATGSVVQRLDYDEFGRVITDTNPGFQPFGFAGGLYDPDTGLVHFGVREYDPLTGRWMAPDPLRFAAGATNFYDYVFGDPLNRIDPTGLGAVGFVAGANAEFGFAGGAGANIGGGVGFFTPSLTASLLDWAGGVVGAAESSLGGFAYQAGNPFAFQTPAGVQGGAGAFAGTGMFIGGAGAGVTYPDSAPALCNDPAAPTNAKPLALALGAAAGVGGGAFISNADTVNDLGGPFNALNINLPVLGVQVQWGGGIWAAAVTVGPSLGADISFYPTNTATGDLMDLISM